MYQLTQLQDLISTTALADDTKAALLQAVEAVRKQVERDQAERQKDSPQEYWDTVSVIAKDAFEEHGDDASAADEFIHESVDGNYWVIYTHANYKTLQYTDHDDAFEEFGDLPREWHKILPFVAFCAMKADVLEKYQELVAAFEDKDEDEDDTNTEED
jgi:hypothetical protein